MIQKIGNISINVKYGPKRAGDADSLFASTEKIKKDMNWIPKYDDLDLICKSAFEWENKMIGEKK